MNRSLRWLWVFLEHMPLGPGLIFGMGLAVLITSYLSGDVETTLRLLEIASYWMIVVLGTVSVWLLRFERRREIKAFSYLLVFLIVSSIVGLVPAAPGPFRVMHWVFMTALTLFIFIVASRSYVHHKMRTFLDKSNLSKY